MKKQRSVSIGRHRRNCSVCSHAQRDQIELDFIAWRSPASIAAEYGLADRSSVYRHAHAFCLFAKRRTNVRAALERIIEKAGDVEVTASAVVAAIQAYSRINSVGQWVDPSEQVGMRDLYERMTTQEMDVYATTGELPNWFKALTANG